MNQNNIFVSNALRTGLLTGTGWNNNNKSKIFHKYQDIEECKKFYFDCRIQKSAISYTFVAVI